MHFHTSNLETIGFLAKVLSSAHADVRRVRLDTDKAGNLRIKVGEGMWSAPIPSTEDPYRENAGRPECNHKCTHTNLHPHEQHYLDCPVWQFNK